MLPFVVRLGIHTHILTSHPLVRNSPHHYALLHTRFTSSILTPLDALCSREVVKAVLGFVKVSLVIDPRVLRAKVPLFMETMLGWPDVCIECRC